MSIGKHSVEFNLAHRWLRASQIFEDKEVFIAAATAWLEFK